MHHSAVPAAPARRFHYGWIVAATTFVVLLVTAAIRATPGLLMIPLESEFGWNRAVISAAVAINIALFGLIGPFAASVIDRFGLRRVILAAVTLLAISVASTTVMRTQWQLTLLWGIFVGTGTGVTSMVLAAIVATRWFDERRGLVLGALSAANATGQLIFLPVLARMIDQHGWRTATLIVSAASVVVFFVVLVFMRDRPEDMGLRPYGQRLDSPAPARALAPLEALRYAARSRAFWVLGGTFFICGASTNGLIGTHLIAACHDYGIPQVQSAQLLAMMGLFDIVGTTASGWLTDRYSSRHLLFAYYTLRGISLLFLPLTLGERRAASRVVRRVLRSRLDCHRAADGPSDRRSLRPRKHRRGLRLDWRVSSARRVARGVWRRGDADGAGRLSDGLLDRGRTVCAGGRLVPHDRAANIPRASCRASHGAGVRLTARRSGLTTLA